MSSFSVVLDACVLYPAALRDTLLRAADAGLYRLHWSEEILDEVRRNLVENGAADEPAARRLLDQMRRAFPDAAVTGHECLVERMPNHPGDRHVVAAAVKANAQLIVTANLRHFPLRPLRPLDIDVQSPDEFLTHLYDLDPGEITRLLKRQAAFCERPPLTLGQILTTLGKTVPRFVSQVEADLEDDPEAGTPRAPR